MKQTLLTSIVLISLTACSESPQESTSTSNPQDNSTRLEASSVSTTPSDNKNPQASINEAEIATAQAESAMPQPSNASVQLQEVEPEQVLAKVVEQKRNTIREIEMPTEAPKMASVQVAMAADVAVLPSAEPITVAKDVTSQRILSEEEKRVVEQLPGTDRFVKVGDAGQWRLLEADSWSCVLDRDSGLLWETKTHGPQRHAEYQYGLMNQQGNCGGNDCSVAAYIAKVNEVKLCGRDDWRLPNKVELLRLVDYAHLDSIPSIDVRYFSNTQKGRYWSADSFEHSDGHLWSVSFADGFNYIHRKDKIAYLRLVSGQ